MAFGILARRVREQASLVKNIFHTPMSIDATSSISASIRPNYQQIRNDYRTLQNDLQTGNLAGAKTDFATLLKDVPQFNSQLQNGTATTQAGSLSALSMALQSGDINGAKAALALLGQNLGVAQSGLNQIGPWHHRHHHHGTAPVGNNRDQAIQSDFQALSSALQSGNIVGAQQALAQLQKDAPEFATSANSNSVSAATPA